MLYARCRSDFLDSSAPFRIKLFVNILSQVISRASQCANQSFSCLQDGSRMCKKAVRYRSILVQEVLRRHHDNPTKTSDQKPIKILDDKP